MKPRIAMLFLLALISAGFVVLVPPAAPAWACSCVATGQDARADRIVVGTVTEVSNRAIRLEVESVEKGAEAAGPLSLRVGRNESACGYDFRVGGRYRVNAVDGATGLCHGITALPAGPLVSGPPLSAAEPTPVKPAARGWLAAGASVAVLAAGLVAAAVWRRRRG